MTPTPVPTPATFVPPPGGLPPFEVYDAFECTRNRSRYYAEHFVRWRAQVGFADVPRVLFGFRGRLKFFTFTSDTTNMRFALLPNRRMPVTESRVPAADQPLARP